MFVELIVVSGDVPAAEALQRCRCCGIAAELARADTHRLHPLGSSWTLNANVDAARPAMVLQVRRHVEHLGYLSRTESDALAGILPALESAMRATLSADRIHVLLLAEAAPHVHFHIVPRWKDDVPPFGSPLLDKPVPAGVRTADKDEVAAALANVVRQRLQLRSRPPEPSPIVRWVVTALDALQRLTLYDAGLSRWRIPLPRDKKLRSFPGPVERVLTTLRLPREKRASADFATVYVFGWLIALGAATALASLTSPPQWLIATLALVAAWRVLDIASFQMRSILDRRASMLASFERTLLFLGINVAELVLALGLLIMAVSSQTSGAAFRNAFGIVTLTDAPPTGSASLFALKVIFTTVSIVLLAGAASMALGLVGREIEEAPHESKPPGIASDD